jgi:predicted dehydrogenase
MKRLGIGIVGLGLAVKPHALALRDLSGEIEFLGGYSPSAERRRGFASAYGMKVVDSIEALLDNPRLDVLIILTPPRTHAELALRAFGAGKHVLLEKPIDITFPDARHIVKAAQFAERKLAVVFQSRFRPGAMALRQLFAENTLGDLLSVSASVRWWRSAEYFAQPGRGTLARDGGGVLLTQAIHTLDLLLHLAGPAARVMAQCRTSGLREIDTEDIACAVVNFRCGALGVIDATTTAYPGFPERIDFAGARGTAVLEGERLVVQRPGEPPQEVAGATSGGGGADPMAFSHEPHRRLIQDFLESIDLDRTPLASGASALPVHALIDALLASSASGLPAEVAA